MARRNNRYVLAGILLGLLLLAGVLLRAVITIAFFAITVAYVLYPMREYLRDAGLSRRWAAATLAVGAFSIVLTVLGLAGFSLYRRREAVIALITEFPVEFTLQFGGFSYTLERATLVEPLAGLVRDIAVNAASAAPVLGLKLLLFSLIVYGLLLRSAAVSQAVFAVVPHQYHGIVQRFHLRTRDTLYGIYILQAATATGTFLVALITFIPLGYPAPFTLALIAGGLQFIPILGPGVLLGVLAVADILAGNIERAVLVAVIGGVVIGLVPDMIIRPRLARYAADLSVTLYFVGFVGGILSLGVIGFIAGPLIVALVAEAVELVSVREDSSQSTL
ncbi:MAG: AI-2E family transporter [Halobacteriales archaeon]|nr:AI-2E family transporter [Halobacteriales archaeon]